ncbi:MAG: phage portal protein [Hyphomonas sp.]|nr:phage portal protein [Hyphomonas sp.]MBB40966.1 phage portal protein [Hyphomonas sp.]
MAKIGNPFASLLGWFTGGWQASAGTDVKADGALGTSKELDEYLRWGGSNISSTGRPVTAETALRLAAFHRGVNLLSGVLAGSRINVREAGTMNVVTDHPLNLLLNRRPNGWQSGYDLKRYLMQSVLLRGNGYAYIVRSRFAPFKILRLIPMAPDNTLCEQQNDLSLKYTYTRRDGGKMTLEQDQVLHIRGMSDDGVVGQSILQHAREVLGIGDAGQAHAGRFFRNGNFLDTVLEAENSLGDEGAENLRKSIDAYRGADPTTRTLVLEQGVKMKQLNLSARDVEFIEQRKLSIMEIAMFLGVPPALLGFMEGAPALGGGGMEQISIGFRTYTLGDWFEAFEGAIERDLLGDDMSIEAKVDDTGLIRGDFATRWTGWTRALQFGAMSPDEVRAREGLPPRPDGTGTSFYPPPNMAAAARQGD